MSETKTYFKNFLQSAVSLILTFSLTILQHYHIHQNAPIPPSLFLSVQHYFYLPLPSSPLFTPLSVIPTFFTTPLHTRGERDLIDWGRAPTILSATFFRQKSKCFWSINNKLLDLYSKTALSLCQNGQYRVNAGSNSLLKLRAPGKNKKESNLLKDDFMVSGEVLVLCVTITMDQTLPL